ncbi:MAG: Oxysterol binding protein [Geoglossum umbratile]|nr:MAG: Oxysterol binding protein [Geoglossum umbratile]
MSSSNGNGEGAGVAAANKGSWSSFLKSIASFSGDLSSLTAPPFILSSTSLVEYSSYWAEHPSVFVAPASESDAAKRALLVLKWFLSTLKQQYSSRNEKLGSEKKPLNPFLGELFLGKWEDEAGTTELISEQVSHHPPVTAYTIWNQEHGVRLQGYNGQKASFSVRTINVKQIGHAIYHIGAYNEDYLITLPSLHIEGLVYGSPYVELNSNTYIQSSSGYTSKISYSGKGWVSGKKNSFTATLYPEGKEKDILYSVEGQWNDSFTIRDAKSKTEIETYSPKASQTTPLTIAPLDQQDNLESRRAWHAVAEAIGKGDMEVTGTEKSKIENAQRELRKKEREEGREWERRYFSGVEPDEKFKLLAGKLGYQLEADKTGGVWRWDEAKYQTLLKMPPQADSKTST